MPMSFGGISKSVVATKIVAADGTGDYTDIQTAINALPAAGGVVYIKEGTYTITSQIDINKDNISLIGSGASTNITTSGNITAIRAENYDKILISQILFTGLGTGTGNKGIYFYNCNDSKICDCWLDNFGDDGIYISSCDRLKLLDNYIGNCGDRGIFLNAGDDTLLEGNSVYNSTDHGIFTKYCYRILLIGNCIYSGSQCGIRVQEYFGGIITSNRIRNNSHSGIYIDNTNKIIINNNYVVDNNTGSYAFNGGIYVDGDSDNNIVLGNVVTGNNIGNITDSGIGNIVQHNQE